MSGPSNRELQRQLRNMEDRLIRRLNEMETNLQFKINSVLQRMDATISLLNNNSVFGVGRAPVAVPRGSQSAPSNRNGVGVVQNAYAMGAMNVPRGRVRPVGSLQALQRMLDDLENEERALRARRLLPAHRD